MKNIKPVLKRDIAVILVITAICAVALLIMDNIRHEGLYAEIYVNGQSVKSVELSSNDNYCFTADDIQGVEFEVKDNQIRVKSSDCKDKICMNTGFISNTNECVICLPKKMYIIITGKDAPQFDAVVG